MTKFTASVLTIIALGCGSLAAQESSNSGPELTASASPTNEGLIGLPVTFTLSTPAQGGEVFNFRLIEGTATSEDFLGFGESFGTIDFEAGETSQTFFVTMRDDFLPEPDENFELVIFNPSGLTVAEPSLTLTIINDDGSLKVPSFFSDGMVLQREKGAKFWGLTCPECPVSVSFAGRSWQTTSAANGEFEVELDNLVASSEGRELIVTANGESTTFSDVLVGEVWMGAGQSNMEFPFSFLPSPANDLVVATANDPLLRLYLPIEQGRENPADFIEGRWLSAVRDDMPDMPAVPYHYAKRLREELNVPVAIMECAWGGQRIEAFISDERLSTFPRGQEVLAERQFFYDRFFAFEEELAAFEANPVGTRPEPPSPDPRFEAFLAGQIFNGMVNPLVGYGLRGIIFYQGEANTFDFSSPDYQESLEVLVEDWRAHWGEELPFYYVQLANFVSEQRPRWVNIQNDQRLALAEIPSSGIAITNEVGNPNDIHPVDKTPVADRLVRWALTNEYGRTNIIQSGPLYRSSIRSGSSVIVEFDHSLGLSTSDSLTPGSFELREENGPWTSADAFLDGERVVVSALGIAEPAAVRYAWSPDPVTANLVNVDGLPASVFEAIPDPEVVSPDPTTLTISANPTNEGLIGLLVNFQLSAPAVGGEKINFSLSAGSANPLEDYLPWENGVVDFASGETSQTLILTMVDDAVVEPNETFNINITNPVNLELNQTTLELVIINDDSVLDDYGNSFGLPPESRAIFSDDDNDGIPFAIEYAFNLNPLVRATPDYVPGLTLANGEPFGLPVILQETNSETGELDIKYVFLRRVDSFPTVIYTIETSTDGVNFEASPPDNVVPITEFWEQVELIIGGTSKSELGRCIARVRVVTQDLDGDGFGDGF